VELRQLAILLVLGCSLWGCGAVHSRTPTANIPRLLLEQARPIGTGARFRPAATGSVRGRCIPSLGARSAAHVEVFASNRVVIVAAGIGVREPWTLSAGRITHALCYGELVTLEPTGVVLIRQGARARLRTLFHAWGQSLSTSQLASFRATRGRHVNVFVNGKLWHRSPGSVPLAAHAEIVLEVGPYVPPHSSYTFPAGE
jgi:hypothetical protein